MRLTRLPIILCMLSSLAAYAEEPASQSTQPAPASQPTVAKKGSIVATIDADGYFEPVESTEVRVRPRQYQGDLTIASAAAHGASVKSGDVILAIDPAGLDRQIAAADNELTAAKANANKAEADVTLGEQGDQLAMKNQQRDLANAEAALKWWDDVDGKQMATSADLMVKNARASVEDQTDELEQLKKMYKSEELTNATADIVVKRALRGLDNSKIGMGMQEDRARKLKEFESTISRQKVADAIDGQKQALAGLQAAQAQAKVIRQTALVTAKLGVDKAQLKLDELKSDREAFTVKAATDGTVYVGQLTGGAWQNANPKTIRAGEKVQPAQVVMTVVPDGKLRFVIDVPESKLNWIKSGMPARVVPSALPEATMEGTIGSPAPTGAPKDAGQAFSTPIELAKVDPKLSAGEKGTAHIEVAKVSDVLLVPAGAVSRGRVKIKGVDGKDVWKDVVVGYSDVDNVEIRQGLTEGDQLSTKAGK